MQKMAFPVVGCYPHVQSNTTSAYLYRCAITNIQMSSNVHLCAAVGQIGASQSVILRHARQAVFLIFTKLWLNCQNHSGVRVTLRLSDQHDQTEYHDYHMTGM